MGTSSKFFCSNQLHFNKTDENNAFSISAPSYCAPKGAEENLNQLIEILEIKSQNDIELQVEENYNRGTCVEIQKSE